MGGMNQEETAVRVEREVLKERGYACRRLLGEGAFSRVYLVESRVFGERYACKVGKNVSLAKREAEMMARAHHPLFPQYRGLWQEAGFSFLLMEYLPGSSLEDALIRRGRFSPGQTVRVGMELAEGLCCLHREGLLFRDVKPANIVIRQDGRVGLVDFGCVCGVREAACSRAGSPGFAAPEQLAGPLPEPLSRQGVLPLYSVSGAEAAEQTQKEKKLTPACDVYALGQTLKAMLGTGGGKRLLRVLEDCTRRQAEDRFPNMEEVMGALRPLMEKEDKNRDKNKGGSRIGLLCRKSVYEPCVFCRKEWGTGL